MGRPMDEPVDPADVEVTARAILDRHIRMVNGCCRECFVANTQYVRHPCGQAEWAAKMTGHNMTVRFLNP